MMVVCAPQSWERPFGLLEFVLETRVSGRSCPQFLGASAPEVSPWTVCKVLEWPACGSFVGVALPTIQTWLFKTEFLFVSSVALALFGRLSKLSNLKFKKKIFLHTVTNSFSWWKKKVCRRISPPSFLILYLCSHHFCFFSSCDGAGRRVSSVPEITGVAFAFVFTRGSLSYSIVHFSSGLFPWILILCLTPWLGCLIYLAVSFLWI